MTQTVTDGRSTLAIDVMLDQNSARTKTYKIIRRRAAGKQSKADITADTNALIALLPEAGLTAAAREV